MTEFNGFKDYLLTQRLSELTISAYLSDLTQFSCWYEESTNQTLNPKTLTSTDVQGYKRYLLTSQNSAPATVNRRLAALRAYTSWAINSGQIHHNPLNGIKGVSAHKNGPRHLTPPEQKALLQEASKNISAAGTEAAKRQAIRDRTIVLMLLHTGLRVSELCQLQLNDIQIDHAGGEVHVNPDNGRKHRVVPINKITRQALNDWLAVRPQVNTEIIFVGKHLEPASPLLVQRVLAELGRRAGVEVTPQELRHTFGKNLVNSGVSLEKVATLMGHSSLNTTMAYASSDQDDLSWAVEALID